MADKYEGQVELLTSGEVVDHMAARFWARPPSAGRVGSWGGTMWPTSREVSRVTAGEYEVRTDQGSGRLLVSSAGTSVRGGRVFQTFDVKGTGHPPF